MKNNKMEVFKKNLASLGLSQGFIFKALEYFNELEEERELQEMDDLLEVIQYYDKIGSYTCNTNLSEINLIDFRRDLLIIKEEFPKSLNLELYFKNIESFELQLLYCLNYLYY